MCEFLRTWRPSRQGQKPRRICTAAYLGMLYVTAVDDISVAWANMHFSCPARGKSMLARLLSLMAHCVSAWCVSWMPESLRAVMCLQSSWTLFDTPPEAQPDCRMRDESPVRRASSLLETYTHQNKTLTHHL
jgi:hypothetical protein